MIDDLLLQNWSTLHSHSIDLKFRLRQSGAEQTRLLPCLAPVGREHRLLPPHQDDPSQGMLNGTVSRVDSDFFASLSAFSVCALSAGDAGTLR